MNRERWHPFPVTTPEERALFSRLPGVDEVLVTAISPRGERALRVRRAVAIEEPHAGVETAQAVCRLTFVDAPATDETLADDLWSLAAAFLSQRAADARAEAGAPG